MRPAELYTQPNALAKHYSSFRVSERLLLTGHSHQAWPDSGFSGQQQAWIDAAELVDDKWSRAFAKADEVRAGFRRLLDDPDAELSLAPNTHELVVRFLSALDFRNRPRLVASDGEFHTIRRLLDRLMEEPGIEVVRIPTSNVKSLAAQLAEAIDSRTAAVLCSSVLFQSACIVPGLPILADACTRHGAELLIDAYHHLNVVPFDPSGLATAFIVGGGYKYCQLGEGNCFLRVPASCSLRPITTGWFTEFEALADDRPDRVPYGKGAARFAGATYDPVSHYRAASVFAFFVEQGLSPEFLREVSQHQIHLLAERFDALDLDPRLICRDNETPLTEIAGFLVFWSDRAGEICDALKLHGVSTDHRGNALRFGPAPYLSDAQLVEAIMKLGDVCRQLAS